MGLFSSTNGDSQIGIDFLPDGVALAQVQTGRGESGRILRNQFVAAAGQEAQVDALREWVRSNNLQKTPCVCLVASDDCDVYQVERPEVEDAELVAAVTWKIKDLVNYDVTHAVVDCYPMPVSKKNNQRQVGVVSARETVIGNYVESIKSCGMQLVALDIHELVRSNLQLVQNGAGQSLALLSLTASGGLLSIHHDTDLYVSRDIMIGSDQLAQASGEDSEAFDSLLLEVQRSVDYFESYYGIGSVTSLRLFPPLPQVEKMALYLQNLTNFDIEFVSFAGDGESPGLEPHCFHAYCAALRGVSQ